jgi:hypothetical protein
VSPPSKNDKEVIQPFCAAHLDDAPQQFTCFYFLKGLKMKIKFTKIIAISCVSLAFFGCVARADSDDDKWIARCMKDNKDEGAKESVVYKYCSCMNDKMDKDETRSISEWEKTHKKEMKECERKAGWK